MGLFRCSTVLAFTHAQRTPQLERRRKLRVAQALPPSMVQLLGSLSTARQVSSCYGEAGLGLRLCSGTLHLALALLGAELVAQDRHLRTPQRSSARCAWHAAMNELRGYGPDGNARNNVPTVLRALATHRRVIAEVLSGGITLQCIHKLL